MRWLASGSLVLTMSAPLVHGPGGSVYYVCPGNVFTNTLSAKEAAQKGCKAKEATEPTTISGPKPRSASAAPASGAGVEARVDRNEQKARDSDAKRILSDELSKAQGELDALKKEYNNGSPSVGVMSATTRSTWIARPT
jgi:hypothetical protein